MNQSIAIGLALVILSALVYDYFVNDFFFTIFWAKKFTELLEWLKFWR